MHATPRLASITLDCNDPVALAQFWSQLLEGTVTHSNDRFAVVATPSRILITCVRVPDHREPSWPQPGTPKQIHLDLAVPDLDVAEHRAVEMGAVVADHQPARRQLRVLIDPAGHPFCLCLPRTDLNG